jgi:hypothetical protein
MPASAKATLGVSLILSPTTAIRNGSDKFASCRTECHDHGIGARALYDHRRHSEGRRLPFNQRVHPPVGLTTFVVKHTKPERRFLHTVSRAFEA